MSNNTYLIMGKKVSFRKTYPVYYRKDKDSAAKELGVTLKRMYDIE